MKTPSAIVDSKESNLSLKGYGFTAVKMAHTLNTILVLGLWFA